MERVRGGDEAAFTAPVERGRRALPGTARLGFADDAAAAVAIQDRNEV